MRTGTKLLAARQHQRLDTLFAGDIYVDVEATWGVYQHMIEAYREPDRSHARQLMAAVISSLSAGVAKALKELARLNWPVGQQLLETGGFRPRLHPQSR